MRNIVAVVVYVEWAVSLRLDADGMLTVDPYAFRGDI